MSMLLCAQGGCYNDDFRRVRRWRPRTIGPRPSGRKGSASQSRLQGLHRGWRPRPDETDVCGLPTGPKACERGQEVRQVRPDSVDPRVVGRGTAREDGQARSRTKAGQRRRRRRRPQSANQHHQENELPVLTWALTEHQNFKETSFQKSINDEDNLQSTLGTKSPLVLITTQLYHLSKSKIPFQQHSFLPVLTSYFCSAMTF